MIFPSRNHWKEIDINGKILSTSGKIPLTSGKILSNQWKDPERTIKMHGLKCSYLQVTFICILYKSRSCIAVSAREEIYVLYFRACGEGLHASAVEARRRTEEPRNVRREVGRV